MSAKLPIRYSLYTPQEVQRRFADRLRERRLRLGWMQATLATRSGVSLATVRRFERDGQITLANFLRLTQALGVLDELTDRFDAPAVRSLDELAAASRPVRQRGRQ